MAIKPNTKLKAPPDCPRVVYTVDIGVYYLTHGGEIRRETTTAWVRTDRQRYNLRHIRPDEFSSGRDVVELARSIVKDLGEGRRIALGFEAPMWLPLRTEQLEWLRLFEPRFEAEATREWYLQSGAAATLKAISLGVLLFSQISKLKKQKVSLSTDSSGEIQLFEAFVTGNYRLEPRVGVTQHVWDAFTGCLAWGALKEGYKVVLPATPHCLHGDGTAQPPSVFSVWHAIAQHLNLQIAGPLDCQVVGLEANGPHMQ